MSWIVNSKRRSSALVIDWMPWSTVGMEKRTEMQVELEPHRKPERPVNRDDYLEAFLGVLAQEMYYLGNW